MPQLPNDVGGTISGELPPQHGDHNPNTQSQAIQPNLGHLPPQPESLEAKKPWYRRTTAKVGALVLALTATASITYGITTATDGNREPAGAGHSGVSTSGSEIPSANPAAPNTSQEADVVTGEPSRPTEPLPDVPPLKDLKLVEKQLENDKLSVEETNALLSLQLSSILTHEDLEKATFEGPYLGGDWVKGRLIYNVSDSPSENGTSAKGSAFGNLVDFTRNAGAKDGEENVAVVKVEAPKVPRAQIYVKIVDLTGKIPEQTAPLRIAGNTGMEQTALVKIYGHRGNVKAETRIEVPVGQAYIKDKTGKGKWQYLSTPHPRF